MPRIVLAGPVDDETSWAARRKSYVETFEHGGSALLDEVDAEPARRGLVPGWLQLYRVAAARR
jgi:hypothetical protein